LLVAAEACADGAPPVQVMVLGTYHMDNPGLDLHNARADDVLTPRRQAELAAVAEALAAFKPTVIAIERVTARAGVRGCGVSRGSTVRSSPVVATSVSRSVIGSPVSPASRPCTASTSSHRRASPITSRSSACSAGVQRRGEDAALATLMSRTGKLIADFENLQASSTVAELLIDANDPRHAGRPVDVLPDAGLRRRRGPARRRAPRLLVHAQREDLRQADRRRETR